MQTQLEVKHPLQVIIKNVYGMERIYPLNATAKIFTSLTRKKTLERDEINEIKRLGYTVEVISEKL